MYVYKPPLCALLIMPPFPFKLYTIHNTTRVMDSKKLLFTSVSLSLAIQCYYYHGAPLINIYVYFRKNVV